MATPEANEQAKSDREAKEAEQPKAESAIIEQAEPEVTEAAAEAEAIVEAKAKPKRSRKRDKVAVA